MKKMYRCKKFEKRKHQKYNIEKENMRKIKSTENSKVIIFTKKFFSFISRLKFFFSNFHLQ